MSSTLEVGQKLVDLCKQHKYAEAMETLYSKDIVSIEAVGAPGKDAKTVGYAGVKAKGEWWSANHESHSAQVSGPWPHGDRFIVRFTYEVTPKFGPMNGKKITMDEAALYTVKEGRVVHEEFFYSMG